MTTDTLASGVLATRGDWMLDCEPRLVQLEALSRSYYGVSGYTPEGRRPAPIAQVPGGFSEPARGWGHFLEMRLGKTGTALNEMAMLQRDGYARKFLVVAPSKFVGDWEKEATDRKSPVVPRVIDTVAVRRGVLDRTHTGAFVINFEALAQRAVADALVKWTNRALVVCDESIWIKNPSSLASKALLSMAKEAAGTRALSGKPMTQSPYDLWAQMRFLRQLSGVSPVVFRNAYCRMGGFQGKQIVGPNPDALPDLHKRLQACSWFATKLEWLGIGAPDYAERRVKMSDEQVAAYRTMERDYYLLLDDAAVTADQVVTMLLRLQQIAAGFVRDENKNVRWLVPPGRNPRLQEVLYIMENEIPERHKLFIVAQTTPSMDLLMSELQPYRPAVIRGAMSNEDVIENKRRFNEDPKCRVMVGQTKAVKYGHQLMGSRENPCLHTLFYENTYSLDDRSQCEERNRGAGQMGQTTIIDFWSSSQDRAIARALVRKEDVFAAVMQTRNQRAQV